MKRLLWAGPVAVAAAVAATLVARAVAAAILPPLDPRFVEMLPQSVAIFTGFLFTLAVGVFALVARFAKRPIETFQVIAAIALVASWVPDYLIRNDPGASTGAILALVVLHAVAAAAVVWTLSTLTHESA